MTTWARTRPSPLSGAGNAILFSSFWAWQHPGHNRILIYGARGCVRLNKLILLPSRQGWKWWWILRLLIAVFFFFFFRKTELRFRRVDAANCFRAWRTNGIVFIVDAIIKERANAISMSAVKLGCEERLGPALACPIFYTLRLIKTSHGTEPNIHNAVLDTTDWLNM